MSNQDKAASARLQRKQDERKDRRATNEILRASGRFDISALKEAEVDSQLMDRKKV